MAIINSAIAMLGPTQAGKSTLIRTFLYHAKSELPELLGNTDLLIPEFVSDDFGNPVDRTYPTELPDDVYFELKRSLPARGKYTDSQVWSAHHHASLIADDKGEYFSAACQLDKDQIAADKGGKIGIAWDKIFGKSHAILVTLDPTLVTDGDFYNPPKTKTSNVMSNNRVDAELEENIDADDELEIDDVSNDANQDDTRNRSDDDYGEELYDTLDINPALSRQEWGRVLEHLCDSTVKLTVELEYQVPKPGKPIEQAPRQSIAMPRQIALCITKMDKLERRHPDAVRRSRAPGKLLESEFGKDGIRAYEKIKKRFGEANVTLFAVSSIGYNKLTYMKSENPDPEAQRVIGHSLNNWMPLRVHEPFFWILNQFERAVVSHISKNQVPRNKPHIPLYVPPQRERILD